MKKYIGIILAVLLVLLAGYIFLTRDTKSDITADLTEIAETAEMETVTADTTEDPISPTTINTTTMPTATTVPIVEKKETIATPSAQGVSVTGALGTGVEGRALVGEAVEFGKDIGRVYCVITVSGANVPTEVAHVWYYKDQEKARTNLPIKYKKHRTWSYKTIHPQHVGSWRVDVVDASGNVLRSFSFVIR